MASKAKTKTQLLKEQYRKERKRLQQTVRRLEKRGYGAYPGDQLIPDIPKRITEASIRRLKLITPDTLYKKMFFTDNDTGITMSGEEGRKYEREKRSKKSAETRKRRQKYKDEFYRDNDEDFIPPDNRGKLNFDQVVITNYRLSLNRWNEGVVTEMNKWLDNLLDDYEDHEVAQMLMDAQAHGVIFTWHEAYDEQKLKDYLRDMIDYLPGIEDDPLAKKILLRQIEEDIFEDEAWYVPL